jgi:hypothetical protein
MIDYIFVIFILFLLSLFFSGIVIYVAAKMVGEKEGFGTALLAAFIGSIIYAIVFFLLTPNLGWLASIIGGIAWLISLRGLYDIGWMKAIGIAIIVWFLSTIISFILPTVIGPL